MSNEFFVKNAIYFEFSVFILALVITFWIIIDSSRRYRNKWIMPIAAITISFGPFIISKILTTGSMYLMLSSLAVWVLYMVIRPEYTLEEERLLETEGRIRDLTKRYYEYELSKSGNVCPVCGLPIDKDYKICPNCFTHLRKVCPNCKHLVDVDWTACPYCETRLDKKDAIDEE
ncbi:MAG: zinc ribbon domain-containing protein [Caldisericia bacterium]|nr:zinc ribbon domain-containing protein [Caldisericia bacterium]